MSRQNSVRMAVASRTAFEALAVEGGDENDEDDVIETYSQEPPPPSKSALKRAAKAARQTATSPDVQTPLLALPNGSSTSTPINGTAPQPAPPPETFPTISSSTTVAPSNVPEPSVQSQETQPRPNGLPAKKPAPIHVPPTNGIVHPTQTPTPIVAQPSAIPGPVSPTRRRRPSQDLTQQNLQRLDAENPASAKTPRPTRKSPGPQSALIPKEKEHERGRESLRVKGTDQPTANERSKKIKSIVTRTLMTFVMISTFLVILALGQPFVIMLILVCQSLVYKEVTALFELSAQGAHPIEGEGASKSDDRWSKTLSWYFFAVANYFLYGESLIHYFKHVVFSEAWLTPFATNHRFLSFMLYMIGFVGFVTNLKKQFLRQQFGLFCWVHMSLFLIVVSSHFIVNNVLEGLIWFCVPISLVICNDIFAYVWGMSFGRTPLITVSPKKTVEGFVGAFFTTIVFAYGFATVAMRFKYMTCPLHDLGANAWQNITCDENPVFVWRDVPIGEPLITVFSTIMRKPITHIPFAPFQFHAVVMACFASLVAPFGGFFASGFKRAFGIKDFGHSLPGHGGMTDRMDCQFLMGMFSYVYYSSIIRVNHITAGTLLQTIVSSLSTEDQLELYRDLAKNLAGRGLVT